MHQDLGFEIRKLKNESFQFLTQNSVINSLNLLLKRKFLIPPQCLMNTPKGFFSSRSASAKKRTAAIQMLMNYFQTSVEAR